MKNVRILKDAYAGIPPYHHSVFQKLFFRFCYHFYRINPASRNRYRLTSDDNPRWSHKRFEMSRSLDKGLTVSWVNRRSYAYRQVSLGTAIVELIIFHDHASYFCSYHGADLQVAGTTAHATKGASYKANAISIHEHPSNKRHALCARGKGRTEMYLHSGGRSSSAVITLLSNEHRVSILSQSEDSLKISNDGRVYLLLVPNRYQATGAYVGEHLISQDAVLYIVSFSEEDIDTMWAVTSSGMEQFG